MQCVQYIDNILWG